MSERGSAFVDCQYGIGANPTALLQGLSIVPQAKVSTKEVHAGGLFPIAFALGKDYTEAKFTGTPGYEELDFVLGSAFCTASPAGTYQPNVNVENAYQVYKIQVGNATLCEEFTGAAVTGFTLKYSDESVDISGDIIGGALATAATWKTGITGGTYTPILPSHCVIKQAGVALDRVLSAEFNLSGRYKPVYVVNGTSVQVALVETKPEGTIKLEVIADANGLAHLTRLRAGNATVLMSFEATCASPAKTFKLYAYAQVKDVDSFKESDTTYNIAYTLGVVNSPANYAIKALTT